LGFVTEIATSVADLDARVERWVEQISRANPVSMMVGRELFNTLRNRPRSEAVRLGGEAMRRMMQLNGPAPTPDYFKN
jgi:enoyl-CoA hydratase/carnithine racemase